MRVEWLLLLASSIAMGCGPAVSEEELGNVEYGDPVVPGTEEPYPLPELKVPTSETEAADGHAH